MSDTMINYLRAMVVSLPRVSGGKRTKKSHIDDQDQRSDDHPGNSSHAIEGGPATISATNIASAASP